MTDYAQAELPRNDLDTLKDGISLLTETRRNPASEGLA